MTRLISALIIVLSVVTLTGSSILSTPNPMDKEYWPCDIPRLLKRGHPGEWTDCQSYLSLRCCMEGAIKSKEYKFEEKQIINTISELRTKRAFYKCGSSAAFLNIVTFSLCVGVTYASHSIGFNHFNVMQ
ncbi:hypothetical protein DdX_02546 [Ditylenchus destructor]|uniref:Transmembrane protein n=1 Tax=Ditylenchus destructor TaxID=166010 RepID=A0AAD4NEF6_9BILA|nr:hypothetical protein DdX_02546 [Ditylenchus destructor]